MVKIIRETSKNLVLLRKTYFFNRKLSTQARPDLSVFLDEFAIQLYNPKLDLDGVLSVMKKAYMTDSNTSIIYNMNTPEALLEYEHFFCDILKDGLSVVARHLPTNKIVGYCANNMQSQPQHGRPLFFEQCLNKYRDVSFRNYLTSRAIRDREINPFEKYGCEHIFENLFMATLEQFRGRQIGYNLMKNSLEMAQNAANGKYPNTMHEKFNGIVPGIVYGSCSSGFTKRICLNLGFSVIKEIPFAEIEVNGASVADKVSPQHTHTTLVAIKL